MARKMRAYGENELRGAYSLEDYVFSRRHTRGQTIKRWKRPLKSAARQNARRICHKAMSEF